MQRFMIALMLALGCGPVMAQQSTFQTPTGQTVPGAVNMCFNGITNADNSRQTVPCSQLYPLQVGGNVNSAQNGNWFIGGYDSGPVTATGTVNSSSHGAGVSVGGLITVPWARINGGSGIITNFSWTSPGGAVVQYVVRIWAKFPASTTCTDNTNFAGNATDDRALITPPFAITPAAPASTQGDAKTYASQTGVTWDFRNQDNTLNAYVCVVTTATDTADESTSPVVMLSGPQN
jgi:hypothetical protein